MFSHPYISFSPHSKAKSNYKSTISGKLENSGISDVAIVSVHTEKTRLKNLIMIIIIMDLLQETTVFGEHQKVTSAIKLKPEK